MSGTGRPAMPDLAEIDGPGFEWYRELAGESGLNEPEEVQGA